MAKHETKKKGLVFIMTIKCSNCGKHYDYNIDEVCPECGEFTNPHRGNAAPKNQPKFEYNESKREPKSRSFAPTAKIREPSRTKAGKSFSIGKVIPFIIIGLIMLRSCIANNPHRAIPERLPDTPAAYYEDENVYEDDSEAPAMEVFEVQTDIATFSAYVEDTDLGLYDGEKIVAVTLSSHLNSYIKNGSSLFFIGLQYSPLDGSEDKVAIDVTSDLVDSPDFPSDSVHYDFDGARNNEYYEGKLYFSIPEETEDIGLTINESLVENLEVDSATYYLELDY